MALLPDIFSKYALSSEFIQSRKIRINHIAAHKLSVAVSDFISRLERGVLGTGFSIINLPY